MERNKDYLWDEEQNDYVHRVVYRKRYGRIKKTYDIHHIDHNKLNNNIENLVALPHDFHFLLHEVDKRFPLRSKFEIKIAYQFYRWGKKDSKLIGKGKKRRPRGWAKKKKTNKKRIKSLLKESKNDLLRI